MNIYEMRIDQQGRGGGKSGLNMQHRIEQAEMLAISALGWLAADPERLERFVAVSGLDLGDLRRAASEPGFAAGVLDYICSDEPTLLALAEHANLRPEEVAGAQMLLSGPPVD